MYLLKEMCKVDYDLFSDAADLIALFLQGHVANTASIYGHNKLNKSLLSVNYNLLFTWI